MSFFVPDMIFSVSPRKETPREHWYTNKIGIRTMKQNVVAREGWCVVIEPGDEFWGGEKSKPYRSRLMQNPTWGQLFRCAKAAQKKTLDYHHQFFEGVYVADSASDVTVLRLSLGS